MLGMGTMRDIFIARMALCSLLLLSTLLSAKPLNVVHAGIDNPTSQDIASKINAEAWVVMDNQTGEFVLEHNKEIRHYPASITKIATAIMGLEQGQLDDVVSVSKNAAETEGSSLELKSNDKLSMKDLLYGIMLHSGNDGAVAIAEHISESEANFAKK